MKITRFESANDLEIVWDELSDSIYQKRYFLEHLERTNPSNQRYYCLYCNDNLVAGAVVYSQKVNLLTFAKRELLMPMQIIGLPLSCAESGLLGQDEYVAILLDNIFRRERGIILCLNYNQPLLNEAPVQMNSLPTMILELGCRDWEGYVQGLRHPYRRRIKKALAKVEVVKNISSSCTDFTMDHYQQYLQVMERSKTKLETLKERFFKGLPENFRLHSFYKNEQLLYWHIAFQNSNQYIFLFGGLDYALRDEFDSYTNNLIEIIKEALRLGCKSIDFGQTATISKGRFGAVQEQRKMLLYHGNPFLRAGFHLFKKQLGYSREIAEYHVNKELNLSIA